MPSTESKYRSELLKNKTCPCTTNTSGSRAGVQPRMQQSSSQPQIRPDEIVLDRTKLLPPYKVIVHDDDYNEMNYVIFALLQSVNSLSVQEAERIMLTAHLTGQAIVIVCPKEAAEYYQERLLSYNLTATIEPD
jgi:ATP-dependent Clp protease adaptor protein ClpS